ncbi:hypothetical protein SAY87_024879 [Trapa incisa]|uniref:phospholipase D n=1 Tax=Trapa incisa TaxID=236973 RepID=A0AAN7J901_9MYRT|nr:hypothetical protein SAY87_024879 [Trapa incisa]
MDNYGSSQYPYHNSYVYPPPPPNYTYQPPYPYPYGAPTYGYPMHYTPRSPPPAASHSGPIDFHQSPPPPFPPQPPAASFSGGMDYHHQPNPYPYAYTPPQSQQPSFQHYGSFQYSSFHHRHESGSHIPPPANLPCDSPIPTHDNVSESSACRPSVYPPLEDAMSNIHIVEQPSAPASAPAYPQLRASVSVPATSAPSLLSSPLSARHDSRPGPGHFYGYSNDSFSGNWEENYHARIDPMGRPGYAHSSSFSDASSHYRQNMQIVPVLPSKGSLKVLLLHGNLDVWIHEAKNLPNMDMFHKTLGEMFGKLPNTKITSDPYVSIVISRAVIGRTYVISNSENPVWRQHFRLSVAHQAAEVHFLVKDSDVVGSQIIGTVSIPVEQLYTGAKLEGTYPVLNGNGKPCKPGAVLTLSIQYIPMERDSIYHNGVGAGPDYYGVLGTYFPLRKGGNVTLYQDAHVPDGLLPNIRLGNGTYYPHGKCWHDIFNAIRQAQRLIYIAGWSVWHKVRLVRDGSLGSDCSLGELLRSKSQEGVRVLLLVWDDPTSRSILGYQTDGIMQTHDEETRRFFKHSSVQVLLCPRVAGKRHSWIKQKEVGTIYTHHQKTVIVDSDAGYGKRKITAFVGGLDLCDGRYDTPHHDLFRTLETVHKDDYHNPSFSGSTAGCPREPWHDLHCRIDGPAAYDVLANFEERWRRASKPRGIKKLKISYDDALLSIDRIQDILGISDAPFTIENDPECWHVQIFRSIDSSSVKGFPKEPADATRLNLVCGKNVLIDMSIHSAYVKAIRSAQHFIYIENQYFIGSSFNWSQYKDLGANNLIPMEIALKIADKIRAHERFAAYIVVPMWPEGVPTGNATQRILFWQHKTMQMMYETIYKALVEVGLEDAFVPQDFLNFFCLGNREAADAYDPSTAIPSAAASNAPQSLCRKSRRFMIYVHSKGMIVDDEYVILGSANINQRSMEGTRDTEIAMGAYQPQHTWARRSSSPRGQIYGYRMSLWAEHMGVIEGCFTSPESIDCVRTVRSIGEMNWKQFAAEEVSEMRGHLMKYPVEVDRKGKVRPLPGSENFPDVGGNIVGSFLAIQENLTI